jgi:hypothetical protein
MVLVDHRRALSGVVETLADALTIVDASPAKMVNLFRAVSHG